MVKSPLLARTAGATVVRENRARRARRPAGPPGGRAACSDTLRRMRRGRRGGASVLSEFELHSFLLTQSPSLHVKDLVVNKNDAPLV